MDMVAAEKHAATRAAYIHKRKDMVAKRPHVIGYLTEETTPMTRHDQPLHPTTKSSGFGNRCS